MNQEALEKIRALIPHLELSFEMAKIHEGGRGDPTIAIGVKHEDGTGYIAGYFDGREFLDDLKKLTGET